MEPSLIPNVTPVSSEAFREALGPCWQSKPWLPEQTMAVGLGQLHQWLNNSWKHWGQNRWQSPGRAKLNNGWTIQESAGAWNKRWQLGCASFLDVWTTQESTGCGGVGGARSAIVEDIGVVVNTSWISDRNDTVFLPLFGLLVKFQF